MLLIDPKTKVGKNSSNAAKQLCPDCRSIMAEVDRVTENGTSFIWYECTREGCGGQWLEKRAPKKMGVA